MALVFARRVATALLAVVLLSSSAAATWAQTPSRGDAESGSKRSAQARLTPVERAERDLADAKKRRAATAFNLDDIVAMYEHAAAASERLAGESLDDAGDIAAADDAVAAADAQLQAQLLAVYKRPMGAGPPGLTDAMLGAPDAATVLHTAALARAITARASEDVARAELGRALTFDEVTAERVVAAGTRHSVRQLRAASKALSAELAAASAHVESAEDVLADARTDARARAKAATVAAPAPTSSVAIAVDGRFCPVGAPNGFIDSWGYPRSGGRAHQGVDMFAAYGMPVYAIADGTVRVGSNSLGGLTVNLDESNGDYYYYAHLSAISVTDGQAVRAGDILGAVGTSGNAVGTPPHLHWEVHPGGGSAVNPYPLAAALCR